MQLQKEVVEEMAKYLGVTPADIDMSASLSDDMGLGPVEISDLLSHLSNKFDITFDPAEIEDLSTVSDIVVMIEDLSLE